MKVKIGNKIYNSNDEPIMLILEDEDKQNIANMIKSDTKYCVYPEEEKYTKNNGEFIRNWMKL